MKILCAEYGPDGEISIVPVGDNALLRNNDDFYFPDFTTALSCCPQGVVRISRLGKCIAERYAERYYEDVGVGIRFYADSLETRLKEQGLAAEMASAFDASAAISPLVACNGVGDGSYDLKVNGIEVYREEAKLSAASIARLIAVASEFYTLKIGDFLYTGGKFRYRGLKAGDRLQMSLDGKSVLYFKIK